MPDTQAVEKTAEEVNQEKILATLAELGGQRIQEDAIRQEGTEIIIPSTMTPQEAALFLGHWSAQQDETTEFQRKFHYRPWDGAVACRNALKRVFGSSGIHRGEMTFFGRTPPSEVDVQVGHGEAISVPWGQIDVPLFRGSMDMDVWHSPKFGEMFALTIYCAKKFKPHAEALFLLIEEELQEHSIYRGKAIDGAETPNFMDLTMVDPARVIYSDEANSQLEANIWSLLRRTQTMRDLKLPLKRAVLLYGPYGTGKTLAAFRTAQIAAENGWTFIYCRPAEDDLNTVLATARLYQPAVVFVEDLDAEERKVDEEDAIHVMLDAFDGITTKGSEVMMVLTTNFPERINKAMLRPGRLDAVVQIGALDVHGVQRMIESLVPESMREALNYHTIHNAMPDFLPAFVKEAADRAIRYAIARGDDPIRLTTEDFVLAASGLKPQLAMMQDAQEPTGPPRLEQTFDHIVKRAVDSAYLERDGDRVMEVSTD